jgi:TetR/AcrR family transcriptional regulator, lmrAB and yxaGH operons repressor
MPRPKSDSRAKIVDGARTLLRRQGYHGTGLAEIIEVSGAPRGSVYFLFPGGKEEIAAAAVRASATSIPELLDQARQGATVEQWVRAVLDHFAQQLSGSGYTEGCPITTTVLDAVPGSPLLTEACRETYDAWQDALVSTLIGYGTPADAAPGLATTLLSCLEGALVLCRARQSTTPLDQIAPHLVTLIKEHP